MLDEFWKGKDSHEHREEKVKNKRRKEETKRNLERKQRRNREKKNEELNCISTYQSCTIQVVFIILCILHVNHNEKIKELTIVTPANINRFF